MSRKVTAAPSLQNAAPKTFSRRVWLSGAALSLTGLLAACAGGGSSYFDGAAPQPGVTASPEPLGTGQVKVALILPLSASGHAGLAAHSMRNAAELALAEFSEPNIQLLIKDDGGSAAGAQSAAQQAVAEGVQIILGPLFAQSVQAVAAVARPAGIPVIAFSTDSSVATHGVYLLSFLPETDVTRIISHSIASGKKSFAAMIPDNAYGSVVEAAFRETAARHGGRIASLERYSADQSRMREAARILAQAARQADALFIPDSAEHVPFMLSSLQEAGVNLQQLQLLGTGLWDEPRTFSEQSMQGGLFAAPDTTTFTIFAQRYRARYTQDPVRTATLSYDATALVAALVKAHNGPNFSEQVLTNPSGFAGIDGIFRFKANGTNERGLAVLRVTPSGGTIVSPAPRSFSASGT